jgi:putative PIN family toxin of toxin-antitoxin system
MRVVVDTNVLISAGLKVDSTPRKAVRWVAANACLLKSVETEDELRRTMAYAKLATLLARGGYVESLLRLIEGAELVPVITSVRACRDPDDDKFLSLAVSGAASLIISGDADLLTLQSFSGIPIIAPAALLAWPSPARPRP